MIAALLALAPPDPAAILAKNGLKKDLTVLAWKEGDGPVKSTNPKLLDLAVCPCSTFKIPNAAIALDLGKIKPEEMIPWDGKKRWIEEWSQPMNLRQAVQASNVGYFQTVARRVGKPNYKTYLKKLNYGNQKLTSKVDEFWLDESLKITPRRQVELMAQLAVGKWPVKPEVHQQIRRAIWFERLGYYGKTGTFNDSAYAWWIGFIERPGAKPLAFAILSREKGTMGPTVRTRATAAFEQMGWLRKTTRE